MSSGTVLCLEARKMLPYMKPVIHVFFFPQKHSNELSVCFVVFTFPYRFNTT